MNDWTPPQDWRRVAAIDAHTAGEPLRILTSGVPHIPGESILDKRAHAVAHLDGLRRMLMWEPRGHADMYGAILTEPATPDGDVGVLFLHNEGFSTMCGHGIIALASVGVTAGWYGVGHPPVVRFDTPAGRVTANVNVDGSVSFRNVPSFVLHRDLPVTVDGTGDLVCDIAYGGCFYAYVDAAAMGVDLSVAETERLIDVGRRIKRAVAETVAIEHPGGSSDLDFLYGTIFVGPPHDSSSHSRNVCVFADGEIDRSPTGTGVSGRLAIHHARGELVCGEPIVVESILGTTFTGKIVDVATVGGVPAIVPEVTGRAWITGRHEFLVDPADPLAAGFLLR